MATVGMLAIATHTDVLRPASRITHRPHIVVAPTGSAFPLTIAQPQLANDSSHPDHGPFPIVIAPKSPSSGVAALVLVVMSLAAASSLAQRVAPAGRGPPAALDSAFTGRDLLTRFCVARR
ncbi:hypothetical protein [Mycobacterium sp.]|uniref:hypothetical protein n=1 Tax=Mycobacterium sp. TaxID=1785 RepID=UPI003BA8E2BF